MSDFKFEVGQQVWDGHYGGVLESPDEDGYCVVKWLDGYKNIATIKDLMPASTIPATWVVHPNGQVTAPTRLTTQDTSATQTWCS